MNNKQIISKPQMVYENDKRQYLAIFYSEIFPDDIHVHDMFFTSSFSNIDTLKKDDDNIRQGGIFTEFEIIKPLIKKFTDDFLDNNKEYSFWRVIMNKKYVYIP